MGRIRSALSRAGTFGRDLGLGERVPKGWIDLPHVWLCYSGSLHRIFALYLECLERLAPSTATLSRDCFCFFCGSFDSISLCLLSFFPKAGWRETYISKDFLPNESILLIYVLVVIWAGVNVVACILGENSPVLFLTVTADYFLGVLLLCHAVESGRNEECLQETQQNLDELRDFMYTIRAQRHDYNFHIHTIRGLILEEKYQECLEYIDDMTVDTAAVNELLTIKDPAVSAQIYTFKLLAESKGIPMEIELHHPLAGVCVNSYELNKVLGNLLQNAIDASECLRDKSYGIKLITFKKGEFCVISVSNKVINRDMLEQLVPGQSTKGGSHEGVGLTSVKLLISRFKGQMYHTLDEDIVTYTVKLPLILT